MSQNRVGLQTVQAYAHTRSGDSMFCEPPPHRKARLEKLEPHRQVTEKTYKKLVAHVYWNLAEWIHAGDWQNSNRKN